jgi:hypothetical protein
VQVKVQENPVLNQKGAQVVHDSTNLGEFAAAEAKPSCRFYIELSSISLAAACFQ